MKETYQSTHEPTLCDGVENGVFAEARAIVAGATERTSASTGAQRAGQKPRRVGPFLTEARTVAVNADGKRLPHNARGLVAPGKPSLRGKDCAHIRARVHASVHASYMDSLQGIMSELRTLIAQHDTMPCRGRKKLRGKLWALRCALVAQLDRPQL